MLYALYEVFQDGELVFGVEEEDASAYLYTTDRAEPNEVTVEGLEEVIEAASRVLTRLKERGE